MLESLQKRWDEMEDYFSTVQPGDLNSFCRYIPGSEYRTTLQSDAIRQLFAQKYATLLNREEGYSDRKLNQTQNEFFDTVDAVVKTLGLTQKIQQLLKILKTPAKQLSEWKSLEHQFNHLNRNQPNFDQAKKQIMDQFAKIKDVHIQNLNLTMLRVYHELRKMGYTHRDLTS